MNQLKVSTRLLMLIGTLSVLLVVIETVSFYLSWISGACRTIHYATLRLHNNRIANEVQ